MNIDRKTIKKRYYEQGKITKPCSSCNKDLPLTAFPVARNRQSGRASHCKECRRARYPYSSVGQKAKHIRHRYGLEIHEYVALWESQGKCCAICAKPIDLNGTAHVDHCHVSGKVRGLLCSPCNRAIGFFNDRPELMLAAAEYVRKV